MHTIKKIHFSIEGKDIANAASLRNLPQALIWTKMGEPTSFPLLAKPFQVAWSLGTAPKKGFFYA